MTKFGQMLDTAVVAPPPVFLLSLTEVASIRRLLAVLEAARAVETWKRTAVVGPHSDPLTLFRLGEALWTALADCDADPLLATNAPLQPTKEG